MKKNEALQKFTQFSGKIDEKGLSKAEYDNFSLEDRSAVRDYIMDKLNSIKGDDRDYFVDSIAEVLTEDVKNQLWEWNHHKISIAIKKLIVECGRMPTKNEIAVECGLSRQTIHRHIKDYSTHPQYAEIMEHHKLMASSVLSKVFSLAMHGNVASARLYLEATGMIQNSKTSSIKNQTNYIQVNGIILDQEAINRMSTEQVEQLIQIIDTKAKD
jgi:DNA-directed RNA polymerase specialized sigma subunit